MFRKFCCAGLDFVEISDVDILHKTRPLQLSYNHKAIVIKFMVSSHILFILGALFNLLSFSKVVGTSLFYCRTATALRAKRRHLHCHITILSVYLQWTLTSPHAK